MIELDDEGQEVEYVDFDLGKLQQLVEALEGMAARARYESYLTFQPYDKQLAFMRAGASYRERLLMAANQVGKTAIGAYETMLHLTGKYPDWWEGRRFDGPTIIWACGETGENVRDTQQRYLCGTPGIDEDFGTGMIPLADFADKPSLARGVTDFYDTIHVKHYRKEGKQWVQDGISSLKFKTYEQGRRKFQSATLDAVWCDEEPPMDIYSEILTRITATRGIVYVTFTPLLGWSDVVRRYLDEPSPDRTVVTMTIEDAKHISEAERARIIAGYPSHEREARSRGIPMLGSGRIFPYADDMIAEDPIPSDYIPLHWLKLWGCDFGIEHPFAAVLILWDRDNDVIHVHNGIRIQGSMGPLIHAAAMIPIAGNVPVAWPHDGNKRELDGEDLAYKYKKAKLRMRPVHATWENGGYSTEAGIYEMDERMKTGRFKVNRMFAPWFDEWRMYHRKDGAIVKINDDLLSATRVAIMDKRFGQAGPIGPDIKDRAKRNGGLADGVDFDLF